MKERLPRNRRQSGTEEKGIRDPRRKGTQIYFSRSTTLTVPREITTACQSLGAAATRHVFGLFFGLDSVQLQLFFLPLLRKEQPDLQTR